MDFGKLCSCQLVAGQLLESCQASSDLIFPVASFPRFSRSLHHTSKTLKSITSIYEPYIPSIFFTEEYIDHHEPHVSSACKPHFTALITAQLFTLSHQHPSAIIRSVPQLLQEELGLSLNKRTPGMLSCAWEMRGAMWGGHGGMNDSQ